MLVFDSRNRSNARDCYDKIKRLRKEQELLKLIDEQEEYKHEKLLRKGHFDLKFLGESKRKLYQIRLINSVNVEKEHIKEVLKEAIVFSRINCDEMIQNCIRYFIASKHLFIVMNHIDVNYF